MDIKQLKIIKNNDVLVPRLTYLTPKKHFDDWIKDELLWVKSFNENNTIVFRPKDGKDYSIPEAKLKFYKLTGR